MEMNGFLKEKGLDPSYLQVFEKLAALTLEWNEKINLTAITEKNDVAVKHFADSLSILNFCEISQNAKVLDIGTGAGFPGVVLKIVRPDIQLFLLDSLKKRFFTYAAYGSFFLPEAV